MGGGVKKLLKKRGFSKSEKKMQGKVTEEKLQKKENDKMKTPGPRNGISLKMKGKKCGPLGEKIQKLRYAEKNTSVGKK